MTSGSRAFLVDTNVLVYVYDPVDPIKQVRALGVLDQLADSGAGCLTTQVLGEFFFTVTRKLKPPISIAEAERTVTNYANSWPVFSLTPARVLEGMRAVRRHGFSYWDALIWATAKHHGIQTVLSEDFSDGSRIEGVRFLDPFAPNFDPTMLDG